MEFRKSSLENMAMNFRNKNILITGGTGFIGSHLIQHLVKLDAFVVTTYQTLNPLSYFFSKKLNEKVIMIQTDVRDFERLFHIVTKFQIDYIFHLAAQPLVEVAFDNPKESLLTNIVGTVNILESIRLYGKVTAAVIASSDKAYGKLSDGKSRLNRDKYLESDPLQGDHPYEVSKSAADLIAYSYYKTYGLPIVITRFGNVYGEGDLNFSRIIPSIIKSHLSDNVLTVRSDGSFVRDYLYVKDVVDGCVSLVQHIPKTKGQSYNFGSLETFSVKNLILHIEKLLHKKINFKILNNTKNEIRYQSLNFQKITKDIGWQPQYSISKTLPRMLKWYQDTLAKI